MRTPLGVIIFISIMLLLDTYVFQAVKSVSQAVSPKAKTIIYSIYWGLTAIAVISFLLFVYTGQDFLGKKVRTYLFATVIGLFLAKVTAGVFFLIDDIRRGVQWGALKLFSSSGAGLMAEACHTCWRRWPARGSRASAAASALTSSVPSCARDTRSSVEVKGACARACRP